jgi:hypothetical protein
MIQAGLKFGVLCISLTPKASTVREIWNSGNQEWMLLTRIEVLS